LLVAAWSSRADPKQLELYDRQRRAVTLNAVQTQTIQNKKDLEASSKEDQADFRSRLRNALDTTDGTRAYLQRLAMIASLRQASEIK
jgi:3-(3-hydroxy-phenyl)propionate hydroxylase